ncbi:Methionine ABC transporter ATP-binding protein [Mucinivorans hirudinis]|uniref:Methionine ABC transporter ATP-binding protein n=1 Tax=Mucinivorans hirudinis TaxID=1433126 RepID=A0A060RDA6_9BACT|nr:Methionine ABC transporter ATP-binding protein [Mucinivorans hirudinis]
MKIKEIYVKGLWSEHDLEWKLTPGVNILSGGNGSGKSTVLRCLGDLFSQGELSSQNICLIDRLRVVFDDGTEIDSTSRFDPSPYNVKVISTFDMSLRAGDDLSRLTGRMVSTQLDWELYKLNNEYLSYQLEVSNQIIDALSRGEQTEGYLTKRRLFFDTIDSLFEHSDKQMVRTDNNLNFTVGCRKITPYQLSSGEKQIIIILTHALISGGEQTIMIMDEPEISLHFDWQRRLIRDILQLNPNLQLILATHSPAVVMDGWVDCVSEINELFI